MTITDEARRLFGVVMENVPEIAEKMPGWYKNALGEWWSRIPDNPNDFDPPLMECPADDPLDIDILAAAALCAESLAKEMSTGMAPTHGRLLLILAIAEGPEAVFRLYLTEKGINNED